jgi:hypothetical protein
MNIPKIINFPNIKEKLNSIFYFCSINENKFLNLDEIQENFIPTANKILNFLSEIKKNYYI